MNINEIKDPKLRQQIIELDRQQNPGRSSTNPILYPVRPIEQKQDGLPALDEGKLRREKRKGRVRCIITLIAFRKRETDDDGNVAGLFHWRDAIAAKLGLDDGDRRLRFIYGQIETTGETGVLVKIEAL